MTDVCTTCTTYLKTWFSNLEELRANFRELSLATPSDLKAFSKCMLGDLLQAPGEGTYSEQKSALASFCLGRLGLPVPSDALDMGEDVMYFLSRISRDPSDPMFDAFFCATLTSRTQVHPLMPSDFPDKQMQAVFGLLPFGSNPALGAVDACLTAAIPSNSFYSGPDPLMDGGRTIREVVKSILYS